MSQGANFVDSATLTQGADLVNSATLSQGADCTDSTTLSQSADFVDSATLSQSFNCVAGATLSQGADRTDSATLFQGGESVDSATLSQSADSATLSREYSVPFSPYYASSVISVHPQNAECHFVPASVECANFYCLLFLLLFVFCFVVRRCLAHFASEIVECIYCINLSEIIWITQTVSLPHPRPPNPECCVY